MTPPLATDLIETVNPLQSMPSVLAIRDMRRRIIASGALSRRPLPLTRLLALDPLTTFRCLRLARAPINHLHRQVTTIPDLIEVLGSAVIQRALDVPVIEGGGTRRIRQLWLHVVATAFAAQSLARSTGLMEPEEAYLRGLLHDVHHWIHYLGVHHHNEPWRLSNEQWLQHWNLPSDLNADVTSFRLVPDDPNSFAFHNASSLIHAAELLAELADFWHPGDENPASRELLLSATSKETLIQAHELRYEVQKAMEEFGLDFSPRGFEYVQPESKGSLRIFEGRSHGNQAELVVSLLQCSRSSSYLGIVTLATSAALRYLDFERAYFVSLNPESGRCWVRAKADLSIRHMTRIEVELTQYEDTLLRQVLQSETPQLLVREAGQKGLLAVLGSDQALAASVSRDFGIPSFLIIDRTLTGRAIHLQEDGQSSSALAGTVAILVDNLQLRLSQERAQRFAVTDPLTRLMNRGVGLMALEHEMARARRDPSPMCVLMLDMDEFKELNDTHGHLVGDQALRMTSNVLRKTLRKSDTVCRYGGEEFLVILPDTTPEEASILATRLFVAVEQGGRELHLPVTVSIGLAAMRESDATTDALVGRADRALYASKSRGRNRFSVDSD